MDTFREFRGRFADWNARFGQGRLLPVMTALAVAGPLMWLAARSGDVDRVPVLSGKRWTSAEVTEVTSQLRAAGLDDFEQVGGQILVPAERLPRYEEVLGQPESRVAHWAQTWEDARGRLNLLSGRRDEETAEEIARARLLSELLSQMPDIDFADVVWDEDSTTGWRRPEKARATVYLKPKPGRRITLELVHSVRLAVAGSRRNLDPSDIVVMDLDGMITYDESTLAPAGAGAGTHLSHLAAVYRQQIVSALADLAPTDVTVRAISAPRREPQPAHSLAPPLPATTRTAMRPTIPQGGPNTRLDLTAAEAVLAPVPTLPAGDDGTEALGDPVPQLFVSIDLPSVETVADGAFPSEDVLRAEVSRRIHDLLLPSEFEGVQLAGLDVDVTPPVPVEATAPATTNVAGMPGMLGRVPEQVWCLAAAIGFVIAAGWQLGRRRSGRSRRRDVRHEGTATTGLNRSQDDQSASHAFAFLLEDAAAAEWLPHEDPRDLAVVLAALGPEEAERFLAKLPDELKVIVLEILSTYQSPPDADTVERVARQLAQQADTARRSEAVPSHGAQPSSGYHNRLPGETVSDAGGAASRVTSFEELTRLDLASLRGLYETIGADVWAMALLGASDRVKRAVMRSLTDPQRDELSRRIAEPQPTRLRDIDEAQQQIVSLAGRGQTAIEPVMS